MTFRRIGRMVRAGLCLVVASVIASAQENVNVTGIVKDSQTGDPLPSASAVLAGTSLGTASDFGGRYTIRNVPPGAYVLRVSYIGYQTFEKSVDVSAGVDISIDVELVAVGIEGEAVIVTAQAQGQNEAINRQLNAVSIVNVVSAARIQELPDANAAESVARLPGVSILRSGGEGNQVVLRGLQPKYNAILVDGVRMASTGSGDRSVDLSMISANMLDGIEVSKTITADQDPDVLGGTVNFRMREAGGGAPQEGVGFSMLAQGGYNGLPNTKEKGNGYNNYKLVASIDGRFFENQQLGVFAQADVERRNLSSNDFGGSYDHLGSSMTEYTTGALNLNDIVRDRRRVNGTLVVDFVHPTGKISAMNLLSTSTTETQNRGETFNIQSNQHSYSLGFSKAKLSVLTNSLTADQYLFPFHLNAKLAHTYSESDNPGDWSVNFLQTSAGIGQYFNVPNLNPQEIPAAANNNLAATILNNAVNSNSFSRERAVTASIDVDVPVNLTADITSIVKWGGKFRRQNRDYRYEQFNNNASFSSPSARIAASMIARQFPSTTGLDPNSLPISAFIDPAFSYGTFLGGDYAMRTGLNYDMMRRIAQMLRDSLSAIGAMQAEGYARNNFLSTTGNHSGHEEQSAGYVMATINIGPQIVIIPGVRYQNIRMTYSAPRGIQSSLSYYAYYHYDTTVSVNYAYWLPNLNVRYQPLSWFDVRLSYSQTLAFPDYAAIVPRIDVGSGSIAWNNFQLKPSRSSNYDAYLSFHDNSIGLLTVGAFLKKIDDLIYPWTFYVSGDKAMPYFPQSITTNPPSGNYAVNTYVNDTYRIDNWGMEFDWQTHFWYLPWALSGLVMNVNYTHIFSEAEYPFVYQYKETPRSPVISIDTFFVDRLLFQPKDIVNLSLGYDFGGFSVRVSMLHQSDVFTGPNFWPQLRSNTTSYRRWDLSVKQDLPWLGLQVYADLNNINGARDVSVLPVGAVPRSMQSYGTTATLGVRWRYHNQSE